MLSNMEEELTYVTINCKTYLLVEPFPSSTEKVLTHWMPPKNKDLVNI